jgi:hypothetical protein
MRRAAGVSCTVVAVDVRRRVPLRVPLRCALAPGRPRFGELCETRRNAADAAAALRASADGELAGELRERLERSSGLDLVMLGFQRFAFTLPLRILGG